MNAKILKLNKAGIPTKWIDAESAATAICKGQVLWSMGSLMGKLTGGIQRATGKRSEMDLPSIMAVDGRIPKHDRKRIVLTNELLFARDNYTCMYCGEKFSAKMLSRDHVHPTSRGGPNVWTNVITSCRRCNHRKANKTPEEAGMKLLAIPFEPTLNESFYLSNRNVLADQAEYLASGFVNVAKPTDQLALER